MPCCCRPRITLPMLGGSALSEGETIRLPLDRNTLDWLAGN